MKCHILFSGKNKKNISKCRLLKILPRVLRVKQRKKGYIHAFNGLLAHSRTEHYSNKKLICSSKRTAKGYATNPPLGNTINPCHAE